MAREKDGSAVKAKEAGEEESVRGGRGATSFELTPAMTDAIAQRVVEKLTARAHDGGNAGSQSTRGIHKLHGYVG